MSSQAPTVSDWLSFNPIAEAYNRVLVPIFFALPSADLVDACNPSVGDRILDVGTGPGVSAVLAEHAIGPDGLVIGIDPSLTMLQTARHRGLFRVVVGALPELPFVDSSFDIVMSSFVIGNILDYRAGLFDMIRVLKPGGTIGVTTWGPGGEEFNQLWKEVLECFVAPQRVQDLKAERLPWQEYFTRGSKLKQALEEAALENVSVSERTYHMSMQQDEYLIAKKSLAEGRIIRHLLSESKWKEFCNEVAERFRARYDQVIEYDRSAFFGIARKPIDPV